MLRFLPVFTLFVASLFACSGCASHAHKKPAKQAAAAGPLTLFVGTISLVNEQGRFALIDNGMAPAPSSGMLLKSYTQGELSGELTASAVRRHPFVIADIRSGSPKKGDRVFYEMPRGSSESQGSTPGQTSVTPPAAAASGSILPALSLPPHLPVGTPISPADQ